MKPGHNTDHARIRAWLKARGHRAADVDREVIPGSAATREGLLGALCRLHGTTLARYDVCAAGTGERVAG